MPNRSEIFLEHFTRALNEQDVQAVTDMHFSPAVFVTDDGKHVCVTPDDVYEYIYNLLSQLSQFGVEKYQPQLIQSMRLSDSISFVTVKWRFQDAADNLCLSLNSSYTLQVADEQELKIIVTVLDDESGELKTLQNT